MASKAPLAPRLAGLFEQLSGAPVQFGLRLWDGSTAGPVDAPVAVLKSPRALRRLLYRPDLGLGRAYVTGDLEFEGDAVDLLRRVVPSLAPLMLESPTRRLARLPSVLPTAARLLWRVLGPPPPRPLSEPGRRPRGGAAVRHHYDAGNDLYRAFLGPSMVYSCAYWPDPTQPDLTETALEDAQTAKLELICRKLQLRPGMRLLDIGCGWGTLLLHAAQHHGVTGVGVTLARKQADLARKRVTEAGCADRVEIRLADCRTITDGPYDAISSVEVTQHIASEALPEYARTLHRLLAPGGRLLAHDVCAHGDLITLQHDAFTKTYLYPDLTMHTFAESISHLESAGFEVLATENLRTHFVATFHAWRANLNRHWENAVTDAGLERARAWQLMLAMGVFSCEQGWAGAQHITAVR